MGIKGIYKEIGPGRRVSLSALSLTTLEPSSSASSNSEPRPFRLAIDISIWQFQVLAARGGSNPAIRTLFYRLVRLLTLAIHPIFVFDGPNKPLFKRNKRSVPKGGATVATAMAKRMIRLFGFAVHDAPGEAEAECAWLQREGVVDAVLSEDVDTIMFGCGMTLRNWTTEGKSSGPPTHVTVYEAEDIAKGESGLDREGMILVALMSGGDYIPEGVPGCGVKVACEAARAGFGRELCKIKKADTKALEEWKERLLRELKTNDSKFFRTKHKALEIPEDFPNMEVLRYYTHPVVSTKTTVDRLKREFPARGAVDVVGLREFVGETFDWSFLGGAIKLTKVLAPGLLVQYLLEGKDESDLVRGITSKRAHASTDSTPEFRVSFIPSDIVKLDLSKEPIEEVEEHGRSGLATNSDDEFEEEAGEEGEPAKKTVKKPFDPSKPDLTWIPETLAKLGIPLAVEEWEDKQRVKEARAASKAKTGKPKNSGMQAGALDRYVKVSKALVVPEKEPTPSLPTLSSSQPSLPLVVSSQPLPPSKPTKKPTMTKSKQSKNTAPKPADINPWTLSGSQISPKVTKTFASSQYEPILISSSPTGPSPKQTLARAQSTPTRARRQYLAGDDDDPFASSPPPSPILQATRKSQSPPSGSQTRPFKRTKSGADTFTSIASSITTTSSVTTVLPPILKKKTQQPKQQQSIKSFGRTVKSSSQTQNKIPIPVEFLCSSDDSEQDDEFPDLNNLTKPKEMSSRPSLAPLPATRQNTAPPRFGSSSGPFDLSTSSSKPVRTGSIPASFQPQPQSLSRPSQHHQSSSLQPSYQPSHFFLQPSNRTKIKSSAAAAAAAPSSFPIEKSILDDSDSYDPFKVSPPSRSRTTTTTKPVINGAMKPRSIFDNDDNDDNDEIYDLTNDDNNDNNNNNNNGHQPLQGAERKKSLFNLSSEEDDRDRDRDRDTMMKWRMSEDVVGVADLCVIDLTGDD
ncbi:hypothetical protein QBC43DRAFT_297613 [Cladorrhinum sp. PSN259]|nr:hypothetical protein QBC43DRAFT_297613 [Cladorrhinum sp. PSN259]